MPTRDFYPIKDYFPQATLHDCDPEQPFRGFCHDTRFLQEGELFLAFQGARAHGYKYATQAVQQGAIAAIVQENCPIALTVPTIVVPDLMAAVQQAAKFHRSKFPGKVYAITGTAGKTSTKEYFAQLAEQLESSPPFYVSHGNWNNALGLSVNISRLPLHPIVNLFELGISGPGDMEDLVTLLRPHAVGITSIGEAHLEKLENCAGVAREKLKIARYAEKGWTTEQAFAYFPQHSLNWKIVDSDLETQGPTLSSNMCHTIMKSPIGEIEVYSSGLFHANNFLIARAMLEDQCSEPEKHYSRKVLINTPKGRGNLECWGPWSIIDDTYNASLPSLRQLIVFLKNIAQHQPVGLLISDIEELGESSYALLDKLFDDHPPIPSKLYYYYTGKEPKSWVKRGALVFSKSSNGMAECYEHARLHNIRVMAFKASRSSGLEHQMHLFIGCLQADRQDVEKVSG